ncbi:MAG: hypothetical protein KJS90_01415 [Acidobacteria bacterium]|nr:hypothetical protein [Acidobacteriota bacterium]
MQSDSGDDPAKTPAPRGSERIVAVVAALVLFAVLLGGFARLGAVLGFDEPVSAPPPSAPPAPSSTLPAPGVASATGSLPPLAPSSSVANPLVPSTLPGQPGTGSTLPPPGVTTSVPASDLPPRWPVSLPDPGEHRVLAVESGEEDRWLLAVPGNVPLAGGRFVAGLEDLDWEVDAVATPRTLTAVGTRGQERVSVTIRPGGDALPSGWLLLDVVYQPTVPAFEPPPTSVVPPEDEVTKRS